MNRFPKLSLPLALLLVATVSSYEHFREKIPNGDRVPHPYLINYMWKGVGHNNADGGGARNPFGIDFERNSYVWDSCICNHDSDGDGRTNGYELGDPDCVWRPESQPDRNTDLSHPGVCEPIGSEMCKGKNDIDFKKSEPFSCEATKSQDVMSMELKFKRTRVPAVETSYFCDYIPFDLPANKSFHIIAHEPLLDNVEIMHHTLVYGCKDDKIPEIMDKRNKQNITGPALCDRMECSELILLWTVGSNGMCYPEVYGQHIGQGGFKGVIMEHHWNNPQKKSGMTDASGTKLYYTEKLRPNTAAWLFWGPMALTLPMGANKYVAEGSCPAECTSGEDFPETFNIVEVVPHMHNYGRALRATHVRPGKFEKVLLLEENYSYDSPTTYKLDPPVEFRRGDEIRVNCTFNTKSATEPVFFGEATSDEMCFILMTVYPYRSSIPTFCMSNSGVGMCNGKIVGDWGNCNLEAYFGKVVGYYWELIEKCDPAGLECRPGCQEVINRVYAKEPCLGNEKVRPVATQWSVNQEDKSYVNMLVSCNKVPDSEGHDEHSNESHDEFENSLCKDVMPPGWPSAAGNVKALSVFVLALCMFALF